MSAKHNFIPWYRDHWKDFLSTGTYELARACWDAGYDEASTYAQTAEAKLDLIEHKVMLEEAHWAWERRKCGNKGLNYAFSLTSARANTASKCLTIIRDIRKG